MGQAWTSNSQSDHVLVVLPDFTQGSYARKLHLVLQQDGSGIIVSVVGIKANYYQIKGYLCSWRVSVQVLDDTCPATSAMQSASPTEVFGQEVEASQR
jgi:hypothetical protein